MPVRKEAVPAPAPAVSPVVPAWGMTDHGHPRAGGSPRRVGFSVSHLDAALLVAGLLIWTALFVFFFAPR
jgi:hypothetical protein